MLTVLNHDKQDGMISRDMRTFRGFKILKINIGRGVENSLTNVTGDSSYIDFNIKIKFVT